MRTHTCVHTRSCTCMCTHIDMHMHTYTHIYTQVPPPHTHTLAQTGLGSGVISEARLHPPSLSPMSSNSAELPPPCPVRAPPHGPQVCLTLQSTFCPQAGSAGIPHPRRLLLGSFHPRLHRLLGYKVPTGLLGTGSRVLSPLLPAKPHAGGPAAVGGGGEPEESESPMSPGARGTFSCNTHPRAHPRAPTHTHTHEGGPPNTGTDA